MPVKGREALRSMVVVETGTETVIEWSSSHSPFLSHPDLVADLVARRAEAAGAASG